ncbi:MAG: (2Fe-2S) ferredoxin domain-containing protein [Candidatus Magasanikbacteria bacterium]
MQGIEVCSGEMCSKRGSQKIYNLLSSSKESKDRQVNYCSCLGHCQRGPNVLVDGTQIFHYSNPDTIEEHVQKQRGDPFKRLSEEELFASENFLGDL